MLPQLRDIERKYPDVVAVIGVHSGKFRTERETPRIHEAALRLGLEHPIVNDRQFRVWRSYAVRAWPTLVVIDPAGRVLGSHAGEFTAPMLDPVLDRMVAAYRERGALAPGALRVEPGEPAIAPGVLRYPGKVLVREDQLVVADTGHHRVIVARLSPDGARASVERVVGSGAPGFEDGVEGRFDAPQGLALDGDTLWVADAGNHAIRAVDLRTGAITTIAGTGHQLRTREDQRDGALSSPWDVAKVGSTLYIAMAGTHQLWALDLASRDARPFAGSGREDILDGPAMASALAQPMGIATDGVRLYFADAESSAIRRSDLLAAGEVTTIVGTGLFDFGDRDGRGDEVLLQHAQGLAVHRDGRLVVADSYNDALKWVDPSTRAAATWVRGLHEPGGVACGERAAYVADTNAHRIAVVPYDTGEVGELEWIDAAG